jgi:hypothetical protein
LVCPNPSNTVVALDTVTVGVDSLNLTPPFQLVGP